MYSSLVIRNQQTLTFVSLDNSIYDLISQIQENKMFETGCHRKFEHDQVFSCFEYVAKIPQKGTKKALSHSYSKASYFAEGAHGLPQGDLHLGPVVHDLQSLLGEAQSRVAS